MLAYYTAVRGPIHTARLLGAALCDSVLALFGAEPAYIRLVGSKQELALFQLAPAELDSHYGYGDKADLIVVSGAALPAWWVGPYVSDRARLRPGAIERSACYASATLAVSRS